MPRPTPPPGRPADDVDPARGGGAGGPDGLAGLDALETLDAWLLSSAQRGNPATRLRAWTRGNAVRPLVDGRAYLEALADAVEDAGQGDLVLFADWRGDPDERVRDEGPAVSELLADAARRGVVVKGLIWRSHLDRLLFSAEANRGLSELVNDAGGEVLLDQRVRPLGSHHQKLVVVRHPARPQDDVAFVGGIDLAHGRRDSTRHEGDPQRQDFADVYGERPAWHDVQVELRGPAVGDVETVFRERWQDKAALSRLPWHVIPDLLRRLDRRADTLPVPLPDPPAAGTAAVQLLRTYPPRSPEYPFAPDGERSVARGYAAALARAHRLVYVEDQYLWSQEVAEVFAAALRRAPGLHLVAVVPRCPDRDGWFSHVASDVGHARAVNLLRAAGGDRVHLLDVENDAGLPVYVHAKACVVDDVWAAVGSDNLNRRSWTHDSELTVAVLDEALDRREPADPAGLGDGARAFARDLRLELWREHLDRGEGDDDDLVDPDAAVAALVRSVTALDAWHDGGRVGPRPPGRLRRHEVVPRKRRHDLVAGPLYRLLLDPDGRTRAMRRAGEY